MGILVLIAALLFGLFTWCSEPSIRLSGLTLQFMGMISTIISLFKVRYYFSKTPLKELYLNWKNRFPKWRKKGVAVVAGTAVLSAVGSIKVQGGGWSPDNPDQSIEKRIAGIINNLERIRKAQDAHSISIEELRVSHEEHKKIMAEENETIEKKIRSVRSDLEYIYTSDFLISLVGLAWLTVGISMSTMAPELSKWLH